MSLQVEDVRPLQTYLHGRRQAFEAEYSTAHPDDKWELVVGGGPLSVVIRRRHDVRHLSPTGVAQVSFVLERMKELPLDELTVDLDGLGLTSLDDISLHCMTNLVHVKLSNNSLTSAGLSCLRVLLANNPALWRLSLEHNSISHFPVDAAILLHTSWAVNPLQTTRRCLLARVLLCC